MTLKENDDAPDFTLSSCRDGEVTLSKLNNEYVILYFYPKDDTPGCTIQANEFSVLNEEFDMLNAKVLGISKDDIKSHDKFISKYELKIDLVYDSKNIAENYGVWVEKSMYGKKYMGIERTSFLIGNGMKILKVWNKVKPEGHANEVLNFIKGL